MLRLLEVCRRTRRSMPNFLLMFLICPLAAGSARASEGKAWIFWSGGFEVRAETEARARALPLLSPEARKRLEREGADPTAANPDNRPGPSEFVAHLRSMGIEPRVVSRLLRAVSADLTSEQWTSLERDPAVDHVETRGTFRRRAEPIDEGSPAPEEPDGRSSGEPIDPRSLTVEDYGPSHAQCEQLGVTQLHEAGFSGAGVLVCLLDGGFYRPHGAFLDATVVATRDFVGDDDEVGYTPGDPDDAPDTDVHGTFTWSALGGFSRGNLVGPAFNARFLLGRTEQTRGETQIEEDHYVAGLEWADSLGAEVISTSLGYLDFDDGSGYPYEALDGRTAVTSRAARKLAARGIVLVTAMGNAGPGPHTLLSPADADSVLAVGAVDGNGHLAFFSSQGPAADGRIKPDVSARGVATWCARRQGGFAGVNGTSLATPLVGGLVALVREAHPEWPAIEIIERMRAAGDQAGAPDSLRGFGIPNGVVAAAIASAVIDVAGVSWRDREAGSAPNDTLPNPGETGSLTIFVRNVGALASSPLVARLRSGSALVVVPTDSVSVPPLAPNELHALDLAFDVTLSEELPPLSRPPLFLGLSGGGQRPVERSVVISVAPDRWYELAAFEVERRCAALVAHVQFLDRGLAVATRLVATRPDGSDPRDLTGWNPAATHRLVGIVEESDVPRTELFLEILVQGLGSPLREGPRAWPPLAGAPGEPCLPSRRVLAAGEALRFDLALDQPGTVSLEIFDILGRRIATPWSQLAVPAGPVHLPGWTPAPEIPSGLYLARLETPESSTTHRILILR